ncbi:MAG TPA: glutamate synthase central domain-containing protein, partial [Candidatus Dormibacteraeota bacterium]|nr:glutamate synthase central domain-containing protein [Candidatus Dormibacteraeota bacterium]
MVEGPSLYDPAFEHDACGVGFVADAGARSRGRVLPLALEALAALGHRGAFAADGESSDGAGVLLPLDPALVRLVAPGLGPSPGVVTAFIPRSRSPRRAARELIERCLANEGLAVAGWRDVPMRLEVLGPSAASSAPAVVQVLIARRTDRSRAAFELDLAVARRRIEAIAADIGLDLAVASASSRTVVYKGLVAGAGLAALYPDLARTLPVRFVVFHQRYATNTRPRWDLAQPFRLLAHNGEINTVRGNRMEVLGRRGDRHRSTAARRLLEAGALVSPSGSDSQSLDEAAELLSLTGWRLDRAMLAMLRESAALRRGPADPAMAAFDEATESLFAPWDGPAAVVFTDGRRVGAILDRNGLRPLAFTVTRDRLVVAASEAGIVPIPAPDIARRGRLSPGELLLVEPGRGLVLEGAAAKEAAVAGSPRRPTTVRAGAARPQPRPGLTPRPTPHRPAMPAALRWLAGLDAERARLDVRTMALEGHEPLWSMGDDTPLPSLARVDRPIADHLRQAFAQVTNPPIDPERERAVLDLSVVVGRRAPLLGGMPRRAPRSLRLDGPVLAGLDELETSLRVAGLRVRRLDATWPASSGPAGLAAALDGLAAAAVRSRADVLVIHHRRMSMDRLPVPSVLGAGAIHAALTHAGLRGRSDIVVEGADLLDVHTVAMTIAAGARAVVPGLAVELASELAGGRGAEGILPGETVARLLAAMESGLRKTLARMGISTAASYVGADLFETVELAGEVVERCFPFAAAWPGGVGFEALARRQLARLATARALQPRPMRFGPAGHAETGPHRVTGMAGDAQVRLPDVGLARYRADGEHHLYAPSTVAAIQERASAAPDDLEARDRFSALTARNPATLRDALRLRRRPPVALDQVELAASIVRRFVASAMSVGALSPEAHQAVTIGMQRLGGAANTGEGGEDAAWYLPDADGRRRDARIKQVASARFGVTAQYLARADQLEIKIAQGSKPGEGGQLPGRKATAYIASLRRAQPGQTL